MENLATFIDLVYTSIKNVFAAGVFNMNMVDHFANYSCQENSQRNTCVEHHHCTNLLRSFKNINQESLYHDLRMLTALFVSNLSLIDLRTS